MPAQTIAGIGLDGDAQQWGFDQGAGDGQHSDGAESVEQVGLDDEGEVRFAVIASRGDGPVVVALHAVQPS